ncbi:sugar phosphate nucleotidyltransferase [Paenibacillus turpanensis]|uniref:sugar phosphate nucleotidyltransferase n=1 Tax=Paenibacillus turpanensis TaxID=2689078 RepID=UPI0014076E43|nr:sugar phosphate nucleotidyltransferase [Paenibacillus turpanensis]
MKGVILAGGSGTRLRPLTTVVNKHLLPVGKFPMIHYSLEKLHSAGIREVMIVTGAQSIGLYAAYIGSGAERGMKVHYAVQDEAGGIAQALGLAESFIGDDEKFIVLLGDNLFEDSLDPFVKKYESQSSGAMVLLKEVEDPRRYGVAELDGGRITSIEEKPEHPKSNYSVTGIYMYDPEVFDIVRRIKPSARGELEITDVNNVYAEAGTLTYDVLEGWWTDAGTHESLREAADRLSKDDGENGK